MLKKTIAALAALTLIGTGCDKTNNEALPEQKNASMQQQQQAPAPKPPTFVLVVSEYPSWSAFLAAAEAGLIDADPGELGAIEKMYGVDIDLQLKDYDTCITMAGNGKADAVALTNMDALIPASTVPSVVILPTSTSNGADALIVPKTITDVKQLRGKKVYMLAKSVSEYTFRRNLEKLGENPSEYRVVNKDPQAAATMFQQRKPGVDAIVVWNPFVLDTLESRKDAHVLFDSTSIPNEIIDSIVASEASLAKPGGDRFAEAVVHTYYALNAKLRASATHNETLMAIGAKFSNITDPAKMGAIVTQTKFFGTSAEGMAVLEKSSLNSTMNTVQRVYVDFEVIPSKIKVTIGPKAAASGLRFDPSYMKAVQQKAGL